MDLYRFVTANIADCSEMRQEDIRPEHTLVGDIGMDGDEFSFIFVRALERALKIKTSQPDWDGVTTVQNVVDMLQKQIAGQAEIR